MASAPQSGHVFISYRQQEPDKQFAHRLAYDLQAAGHPVWIDIQGIEPGEAWNTEIQKALDECYAYVVVLSPEALESRWVRNELLYALREKAGRIYPVLLLDVKLPPEIIAIQYVDFQDNYNKALAELLANLPVPPTSGASSPQQPMHPSKEKARRGPPAWLIGVAGLIVVALAAGIALLSSNLPGSPAPTPTLTQAPPPASQTPTETATAIPTPTVTPAATVGGPDTPLMFVFYATGNSAKVLVGGRTITDRLSQLTGLTIKAGVETSYKPIIDSMCAGQTQLATLNVLAYVYANQLKCAEAAAVSLRSGSPSYASEIIAAKSIAKITDLKGKPFCRLNTDTDSGWIMPKLLLKADGLDPDKDFSEVKMLESYRDVVTAVYQGDCAGGAAFSDARLNVVSSLPDVMSKVKILDTTVLIPNDEFAFQPGVPADIRDKVIQGLTDLSKQQDMIQVLTEMNAWGGVRQVDETFFDPFREFFRSTGYNIEDFVK